MCNFEALRIVGIVQCRQPTSVFAVKISHIVGMGSNYEGNLTMAEQTGYHQRRIVHLQWEYQGVVSRELSR